MSITIVFAYRINDKVKTPLGDVGFIDMLGVDSGGYNTYFVVTTNEATSRWYNEDVLTPAE